MIKAACHCGAVRFAVAEAPRWVLDCSCTICRRYAALWCYRFSEDPVELVEFPDPAASAVYSWNDHEIGFHHCKTCGCVTHFEAIERTPSVILGLNARMMVGLDGPNIPDPPDRQRARGLVLDPARPAGDPRPPSPDAAARAGRLALRPGRPPRQKFYTPSG
jgi:hypothetical protein